LCFLSINLLLIFIAYIYADIVPQIILIYILTLTAIETAVGLALFIVYFKMFKTVELLDFNKIKKKNANWTNSDNNNNINSFFYWLID